MDQSPGTKGKAPLAENAATTVAAEDAQKAPEDETTDVAPTDSQLDRYMQAGMAGVQLEDALSEVIDEETARLAAQAENDEADIRLAAQAENDEADMGPSQVWPSGGP